MLLPFGVAWLPSSLLQSYDAASSFWALGIAMLHLSDEQIRQLVIEVVGTVSQQPVHALPLNKRLVRDLGLGAQRGEILRTIEARMDTFVLDGIHTRCDFTIQDIIDFYADCSRHA